MVPNPRCYFRGEEFLPTITNDNRKVFADQNKIAQTLLAQFYFAKPYHS